MTESRLKNNLIRLVVVCALLVAGAFEMTVASVYYELEIDGERFFLEVAADESTRSLGLSGRESIDANGGMIFVFPKAKVRGFYMRDCVIPIDIVFLGSAGVVTATHTMVPEKPRGHAESDTAYERRLKRYSSLSRSQYAIELRAGTIDRLGIKQGDRFRLDTRWLQNTLR